MAAHAPTESTTHENVCTEHTATYSYHWNDQESYNWCTVPDSSYDVLLFPAIGVTLACLFQGRFSTTAVLIIGGILQGIMFPTNANLGRLGNSIAWWLGIEPYELFLYVFLPPLLLDAAVRIDFFLFKRAWVKILTLAFLVVGGSCGLLIPIMLYVLDLRSEGWTWQYCALFGSMVASTDAVAIVSTMKASGGPMSLRLLLEGESLLNDASSITLFTIFLSEVMESKQGHHANGGQVLGNILSKMLLLAVGGAVIGLAFGIAMRYVLRWMRHGGAGIEQQVALTFAVGYLSYYTANAPANFSGVIAVAVFGLYGAATSKWEMSAKVEESGAFDAFWDSIAFIANAIVFFYSGVACVNFFVRSAQQLAAEDQLSAFIGTLWRFPLVYICIFAVRFFLILIFRPLFRLSRQDLSYKEILFATVAGLRGSVSLILAQAVVVDPATRADDVQSIRIKAEIVMWTAGFVLLTLIVNAPLLPWVLRITGLSKVPDTKMRMRRRAVRALMSHTQNAIRDLRNDEDEMLRGVDWGAVDKYVSTKECYEHYKDPTATPKPTRKWYKPWSLFRKKPKEEDESLDSQGSVHVSRHNRKALALQKGKKSNSSGLTADFTLKEADTVFGRPSEWTSPVTDIETGQSGMEDNTDADESSDDDSNELPFLARESMAPPRPSHDQKGLKNADAPGRHSKEVMEIPEAVEAVTGVNASYLPDHKRESQEHTKDRRGLQTGSEGPDKTSKSSFEVMTPRAKAVASAARAAACQVIMTPGGPLPSPAGCPGHGDWHAAAAGNDDTVMRAAKGLRQLRSSSDKRQPLAQSSSDATVGGGAASSVHDSWNSMAKASTEDSAQGTQIQAQGSSPRAKGGILRRPGMGGSADDLERLPYKGNAPNSPTVSWHRSVTDKEIHRRPPLSNIFPTAAPSPRIPEASPREPTHDDRQTAQVSQDATEQAAAGQAPSRQPMDAEPETAPRGSVSSWPRSIANADGRPSLFSAFLSAGQQPRAASTALPPTSLERLPSKQAEAVVQRAASASLSSTTSWPRAIGHGPEIRPALLQAFPFAGQGPVPGSGQVMGPDRMPSMPTAAQRLAQLQRSIAARGGSMPSPTSSWGRTVSQGPDRHASLHDAFPREENPASTSSIGGAMGQRYAAAARAGSMPKDSGISWPRSVMHGPDKHRSLFEAFAGLQRDSTHGPGAHAEAHDSFMTAVASTGPQKRTPLQGLFDDHDSNGPPTDHQSTWAAGDKNTKALSEALRQRLSASKEGERPARPPDSPRPPKDIKGATEFDTVEEEDEKHQRFQEACYLHPSEVAERRVRLVVGMKRYFHGKRMEGLLSVKALRVLDNAMDTIIEKPDDPKSGWSILERDASGGWIMHVFALCVYQLRKTVIRLRRRHHDSGGFWLTVRRGLAWPLQKMGQLAHVVLSKALLLSCEVALEYMLALTYSPQVQILRANPAAGVLLEEIDAELAQVWRFILEREVEAPERFQAIQSYRATMAVLRQQALFVEQLFDTGVIDEMEKEELLHPIDDRERRLARKGPIWRTPMAFDVLRNLPFLRHVPQRAVEVMLRHGQLRMYSNRELVRSGKDGRGLFVVINGLVRIGYQDPLGNTQEYFLGTGGMSGLYHALTDEHLPGGRLEARAEGNALGKGPVVFEVHQSAIEIIRKLAARGDAMFQQVEVDMFRMAALFVVERLKPWLMTYLAALLATAAPAPLIRQASGRSSGPDTDMDENFESGSHAADDSFTGGLSTTDFEGASLEDIQEVSRHRVWTAYIQLVQSLTSSDLVELPPGTSYRHCSSAVLLRGSIRTSGNHCSVISKAIEGSDTPQETDEAIKYKAPFVLPWIVVDDAMANQPESFVPFTAGSQGAVLMVCTTLKARGVKEASVLNLGSLHADLAKPSSQTGLSEASSGPTPDTSSREDSDVPGDLKRKSSPEEPPKRPTLVRHSISRAPPLSLEASDAASEMQDPGHKPGQQPEWWQNRRASTSAPRRQMQRSASSGRLQPARPEARLQRSKTGLKLNHQETLIEEESGDDSDPDSPVKGRAADAKAPGSHEQLKQSQTGNSSPQGPGRTSPSRLKKSTAPDSSDV
ncbi:g1831 [Coccomyxa viridis]|uniref:G1831 protein n=1 Tax=Coccomyxa viridis TaxID=1274662 RepID=A0ABP1FMN5_9CHLO